MLNSVSIKTVLLIDSCLSLDDHTVYVLCYFLMFYVFLSASLYFSKRGAY